LFENHFGGLTNGELFHDEQTDTYKMFSGTGKAFHVNYLTFRELFKNMGERRDLCILESGIASAGTQSTYLFNEYVRKFGGRFWSVDINSDLVQRHKGNMCPATTLVCDDSVNFFKNWETDVDVVYLDSYDLDFRNPHPSAEHGLNEYLALQPVLKGGSLLLVDDTPVEPYWLPFRNQLYNEMTEYYATHQNTLPGKGQYILTTIPKEKMLMHNYQVLYRL